ncbi:hypothetical protein IX51_05185 [uncultured archaeon]|nr:hypothetical protein IX51_05185 [uncultured archaeon]
MSDSSAANKTGKISESEIIDDYALGRVPQARRKSGWSLSWLSMGIVSTLVQLDIGYFVAAVAGMKLAIIADILVAIFGGTLGWAVSRVSFAEKLSSTVTSRFYGFGARGSVIASAIFGFMILGFLALENALLYYGTIFALGWTPNLGNEILILGILTVAWILLTTYGINAVLKVSSYLLIVFIILLGYMFYVAVFASGTGVGAIFSHGPLIPGMGSSTTRFMIAVTTLAGSAGALALVDADYARYARTKKDLPIMSYMGSIMIDIVIMISGSVIVYGGLQPAISYVIAHNIVPTGTTAGAYVNSLASNNTGAFFIILSSVVGFILMYAAQAKAQVLNTYSGSLALANFFDATAKWKPGRLVMVILGNIVALIMIFVGILGFISGYLDILGITTTSFAGIMIADYYIVRRGKRANHKSVEAVNIAGVLTILIATGISAYLETQGIFVMGFLLALILVLVLYPPLRIWVFPESKMLGGKVSASLAMQEEEDL